MLTIEDCIAMSDLTEEEVEAIAEHEHLPMMAALEMGWFLVQTPEGEERVRIMIADDIAAAEAREDYARAARLKRTLRRYVEAHNHIQQ
ncbi:hypothetical protein [Aquisalimonas asiatica]|uniref:Uncharacterized protein n=1 Tax=Aquisalimonas asiatica TaxID=406100 RepID=A0A1H8SUN8_9GAMM|nr:hypothetical protein [Aquisalimonas asiatica]SEO82470.1 hypothetical protein SAMN04488052_103218 [Aquisalimonas asiatica]